MTEPRERAIYLRVDQVRKLDHWCQSLRVSFKTHVYLVGSVLTGKDWRDVDVRIVISDEAFESIPMQTLDLDMLLSEWGQNQTDLPIDCQVQSASEFSTYKGPRNPRGIFPTQPPPPKQEE